MDLLDHTCFIKHYKLFIPTLKYIDRYNCYFRKHFECVKKFGSPTGYSVGNKRISYKKHFYYICSNCSASHGGWNSSFF